MRVSRRCAISPRRIAPARRAPPLSVCSVRMHDGGVAGRRRAARPVAQLGGQLRQQVLALFLEDREQLGVDRVDRVDVLVAFDRHVARTARRARRGRQLGQRLELGHARARPTLACPSGAERRWLDERRGLRSSARARRRCGATAAAALGAARGSGRRRGRCARASAPRRARPAPVACGRSAAAVAASSRRADSISCSARRCQQLRRAAPSGSRRRTGAAGGGSPRPRRRTGAPLRACRSRCACERISACSSSARQVRQVGEADRGRAAGQRMRQRDRRLADRAVQLHRPLGQLGGQAARQLVGLVEVDVEQRDADAQRADDLDAARRSAGAAARSPVAAAGRPRPRSGAARARLRSSRRAAGRRPRRRGRGRSVRRDRRSARTVGRRQLAQRQRLRGLRIERLVAAPAGRSRTSARRPPRAPRRRRRAADRSSSKDTSGVRLRQARSALAAGRPAARRSSASARRQVGRQRQGDGSAVRRPRRSGMAAARTTGSVAARPARCAAALTAAAVRAGVAARGDVLDPVAKLAPAPSSVKSSSARLGRHAGRRAGCCRPARRPRRLRRTPSARPCASCP